MQAFLPSYLEMSLQTFAQQQERMRAQFSGPFGQATGIAGFEEQIRQNMALFERGMKMFSPFAYGRGEDPAAGAAPAPPAGGDDDSLNELKKQVEAMRAQIDKLASKS